MPTMDTGARRVGVLMGGRSSEREVSLDTGAGVLRALTERGYDAVGLDWRDDNELPVLLAEAGVEVVWNALHGTYGEDGAVQGLCACMRIACTGSGILASALAMDKVTSKRIFESNQLRTPAWTVAAAGPVEAAAAALDSWALPLVVKPANEGSSVGVSIVTERAQLAAAIAAATWARSPGASSQTASAPAAGVAAPPLALHPGGHVLVERYIPGAEVCVGILDREVLGTLEVRPKIDFYDYDAKYQRDDTEYLIPPPGFSAATVDEIEHLALSAYHALGCSGYARVDMRVAPDGDAYLLEVNTLPGMTGHSLLPKIAAHRGIDYATLCERILASAA